MDTVQTMINAGLAAFVTAGVWFITRAQTAVLERRIDRHEERTDRLEARGEARFDRLEEQIDVVRSELETKIDVVRSELETKIDAVRSELETKIDAVRTDITQLAFRLGDRPHPQTG